MKRVLLLLATFFAITSCRLSPEDWEEDFTGTWDLVGMTDLDWDTIEDLRNFQVANLIDDIDLEEAEMTLEFRNGKIAFESSISEITGTYIVDEDGLVTVDWYDGDVGVYWMYAQDGYLYMVECNFDDDGDLASENTAFKFRLVSK